MPRKSSPVDHIEATQRRNPVFNANRFKLGTFGTNGKGTANTLVPEAYRPTWAAILRAAERADAMGLEAIVPYSRWKGHELGKLEHPSGVILDPFTWAAGVAQATKYPAIFVTSHAPTIHPIAAAKQCATIDLISNGRLGLNVVAGWNRPELEMFGAPLKEHNERYEHLEEWLKIIRRLWTEEQEFDFDGAFFKIVRGGSRPRPIQRPSPAIMNAGGSEKGRDFAVRTADMCFIQVADDDVEKNRDQVTAYKQLARERYGREVQVWIMASMIQRDSTKEARDYLHHYAVDHADNDTIDAWMKTQFANTKTTSRPDMDALRLRAAAGAGGSIIVGDADSISEQIQRFSDSGIDGALLSWVDFDDGLARLQAEVLPRLENMGLRQRISLSSDF